MLLHVLFNVRPLIPAVVFNFVSSEVDEAVGEHCISILKYICQHLPGKREGWIQLTLIKTVAVQSDLFVFVASTPGL